MIRLARLKSHRLKIAMTQKQLAEKAADAPDVSRFLSEKLNLAELVREAAGQIVGYFPDARLSLELLFDPEYGSGEQLFLGVSTSLPDDEALKVLGRFDREWWVHHANRAHGLLCIDLSDE
jgi:hypothetical protein